MRGGPWVAAGFAAFFVVALVVGVRLLLPWRRTRELPELLIGLGVLGIGPAQLATGIPHGEILWVLASSSAHGLVAGVCMWLAFVPPAGYTRYVASLSSAGA